VPPLAAPTETAGEDAVGDQHQLERAPVAAAPTPAVAEVGQPEAAEHAVPVPGLALPPVRRRADDPLGGSEVDPDTARRLSSPSGGSSLDPDTRATMEGAFGQSFGDVKVHTGGDAADLNSRLQAQAFTHGSDIYFSQGSYDPGSEGGQHLLAHELTHVVQRKQGRDAPSGGSAPTVGRANDPLEAEADRVATDVVGALRRQTRGCGCGQSH